MTLCRQIVWTGAANLERDVSKNEAIIEQDAAVGAQPDVPPFEVTIEIVPRVSFATHQCDFPVLAALVVRNNTNTVVEGMELRIDSQPPIFAPRSWVIDRIEGCAETRVRDRRVSMGVRAMPNSVNTGR